MSGEPKIISANCNNCGGARKAFVQADYSVSDYDEQDIGWWTIIEILECCGCNCLSVRRRRWFSEWDSHFDEEEVSYWPPQQRSLPKWHFHLQDDNLHTAMQEVYVAVSQGMVVLASIGVRTLLDRAFYLLLGEDHGTFAQKLQAMVEKKFLLENEKEIFQRIADVGNAATHRAYVPTQETLITILTAVEFFLYQKFVLPREAKSIEKDTPNKPPKISN